MSTYNANYRIAGVRVKVNFVYCYSQVYCTREFLRVTFLDRKFQKKCAFNHFNVLRHIVIEAACFWC